MFADKPETPLIEKAKFWPYALFYSIYSCGSPSLIMSTIQWNFIWTFGGVPTLMMLGFLICSLCICLGYCIFLCLSDKEERSDAISDKDAKFDVIGPFKKATFFEVNAKLFSARNSTGTYSLSFLNYTIFLVVIATLVNFYPDTFIWNLWAKGYKLSDVAVVRSGYFNIIFGACTSSGIISVALNYFQVTKPECKDKTKIEGEKKQEIDAEYELQEEDTVV